MQKRMGFFLMASVVAPMMFLASFRLTGFIGSHPMRVDVSETHTVTNALLDFERAVWPFNFYQPLAANTFSSGELRLACAIEFAKYSPHDPEQWGHDSLTFVLNSSANVQNGYVVSMNATFYVYHQDSWVEGRFGKGARFGNEYSNLSLSRFYDFYRAPTPTSDGTECAFVEAKAIGNPIEVSMRQVPSWALSKVNKEADRMDVKVDLVYFNGSTYKRVTVPLTLNALPDAGNSFDTALDIDLGDRFGYVDGGPDREDYYRVWLDANSTYRVRLALPEGGGELEFDLYIYDSNRILVAGPLPAAFGAPCSQQFSTGSSGYWFIRVLNAPVAHFQYVLSGAEVEEK